MNCPYDAFAGFQSFGVIPKYTSWVGFERKVCKPAISVYLEPP